MFEVFWSFQTCFKIFNYLRDKNDFWKLILILGAKMFDRIRLYLQRLIVNGSLWNYTKPQDIFRKGDNTPQDGKLNTQPKKTKPLSKSANICYHFVSYFINQYFVAKIWISCVFFPLEIFFFVEWSAIELFRQLPK